MDPSNAERKPIIRAIAIVVAFATAIAVGVVLLKTSDVPSVNPDRDLPRGEASSRVMDYGKVLLWWDRMPSSVVEKSVATRPGSNIHPADYVGPESCKECHTKNYSAWSGHPHRLMNAIASDETVRGDFSGEGRIEYLGGRAEFYRDAAAYKMKLLRDGDVLTYLIRQTIGSRFFQYYVGRLEEGPFPAEHPYRTMDHVLPFGYWLDRQEWVPTVHISDELPDGERADPFAPGLQPEIGRGFVPYSLMCNTCHTTFPLGDSIVRKPQILAASAPFLLHFDMATYSMQAHGDLFPHMNLSRQTAGDQMVVGQAMAMLDAPEHAATLGISCEACHLGGAEHVADPKVPPHFLPHSSLLRLQGEEETVTQQKSHGNINWICSRCHTGARPQLANGISTWNSTEFSDAMKGSCYSELRCIDCHSPHEGIGHEWTSTPLEDDARCIRCHESYREADVIESHTHHPATSSGSRCMNCHMPRMNEGLQDVVRTHTIFSPTDRSMLEANHPNSCNICHTSESIDWTVSRLKAWYGKTYSDEEIDANYQNRSGPVALGWLNSGNEAVRLIATDAVARAADRKLLRPLIETLDDRFLLNRQFARIALEKLLDAPLLNYGYRFYMTHKERRKHIDQMLEDLDAGELGVGDANDASNAE
ncbi:MAG: hypothetical protein ABGZ23_23625 [Fuerstiella sp.]|nr:hypothetical protein [Fuerstiella sp.]